MAEVGIVRALSDGRAELRSERWLPHGCDKVWRALTTADELRTWFVEILDYDRSRLVFAPGAHLAFVAPGCPSGLTPEPLRELETWLAPDRILWSDRLAALENHLNNMPD